MMLRALVEASLALRNALLPQNVCRFAPSCGQYAREAALMLPAHRAVPAILYRLSRCHPLHPGGYDPL